MPQSRKFRVAAIFYSGMYEYDASHAYVKLDDGAGLPRPGPATSPRSRSRSTTPRQRRATVRPLTRAGAQRRRTCAIRDWKELNKNLFSALKLEKIATFIILSIAILVGELLHHLHAALDGDREEQGDRHPEGARARATARILEHLHDRGHDDRRHRHRASAWPRACALRSGLLWFGVRLDPDVYYVDRLPINVDPIDYRGRGAVLRSCITTLATIYPAVAASRLRPGRRDPLRMSAASEKLDWPNAARHRRRPAQDASSTWARRSRCSRASTSTSTPGEILAIVGASGAGKSTLLALHRHARSADLRPHPARRRGADDDERARGWPRCATAHRLRVSVSSPAARVQRARERDDAGPDPGRRSRSEMEKRARALLDEVGLSHRVTHRPGELSRRRAAARRDRARARARPEAAARRRAHRQPRHAPRATPSTTCSSRSTQARHDHRRRHAQLRVRREHAARGAHARRQGRDRRRRSQPGRAHERAGSARAARP